jgi:HEAT repeat protein
MLPFADAPSLPLRKAALAALASIGSPTSSSVLTRAAKKVNYAYEASNATSALLAYARNLGRKGHLDACDRTCRAIIKACQGTQQLPVNSAALAVLADTFGYEALPYLLRASEHQDRAYRISALNLAERIPGVAATRQWIAAAQQSSPTARADIIAMLGRRGDTAVLPFLESSLRARESEVRMAAAESLARIKKADAAADLLRMLGSTDGDEAPRIASLLSWILDERHLDPLTSLLDTLAPAPKAAAITVIAGKGAGRYFEKILALTSDQDPGVRRAAFAALKDLAGPEDLGALLLLLESTADPASVKDLQQALVRAANQAEPARGRARPLLDAMRTSSRPV